MNENGEIRDDLIHASSFILHPSFFQPVDSSGEAGIMRF
jgi:hypothetical protein